jgi:hypothetical protein
MSKSSTGSNGQVVSNTLESTAALVAEVRSTVCKALDNAESRLLEMWAVQEEAAAKADYDPVQI